jgi:hypothetical protein
MTRLREMPGRVDQNRDSLSGTTVLTPEEWSQTAVPCRFLALESAVLRRFVAVGLVALTVAGGGMAALGKSRTPLRVTLTAQNHDPRASASPSVQWGYCVRVRTAAGKSVASTIHLQILQGRKPVGQVGFVSLRKGYDHWCASIGGETNALLAVPRGKRLIFQAVVRAEGVTVKRNWPIVVR